MCFEASASCTILVPSFHPESAVVSSISVHHLEEAAVGLILPVICESAASDPCKLVAADGVSFDKLKDCLP